MSFTQGAPTQPMSILASNVFLTGSSTAGNAFTVQQPGAGNVASFQTSTSSTSLIINPSGNVGIGKTNPGYALDVTGDINFTGTFRQNGSAYIGSQWTGTTSLYFIGNVGIGTTNPGYTLDVSGIVRAGSTVGSSIYLTNSEVKWRGDGTAHFSIFNQNSTFQIRNTSANSEPGTAGSNLVTVTTTGNVGIGVTTPQTALWVPATSATTGIGIYNADVAMILGNTAGSVNSNTGSIQVKAGGSATGIGTSNYNLTLNPLGGNVGVNVPTGTAFSYTFQVIGNIGASAGIISSQNVNGGAGAVISQNVNGGSTAYSYMQWQTDTGSAYIFKNSSTRTTDGGVKTCTFRNDDGDLRLSAASDSPSIYLKSSNGNVGIGTTNPWYLLDVNGTIATRTDIRWNGTGLNAADKKLYSPADGDLEWMTNTGAGVRGFAVSHQGTKIVYLNTSGNSYLNGGNVGIGTASPSQPLDVNGAARVRGNIYNADGTQGYVQMNTGITTIPGYLAFYKADNTRVGYIGWQYDSVNLVLQVENGYTGYVINSKLGVKVAPGSYDLQVAGTIGASGDITALYSDERLKTKTGTLENALDKVCSLETFTYRNNELAQSFGFKDDYQRVGVSAQQVQKVLPEAVRPAPFDAENQSGQNYLTVQYEKLVPLLIEALKEERHLRCRLEERVRALEEGR